MAEVVIRATREVLSVPRRFEGQDHVPLHQLPREPWHVISAEIEFDVGGSTEEEALQNLADTIAELSNSEPRVYLTRLDNHAGVTYEHGEELIELPEGRDKAERTQLAEQPKEDGDAHPSPAPQSSTGRTEQASYVRQQTFGRRR